MIKFNYSCDELRSFREKIMPALPENDPFFLPSHKPSMGKKYHSYFLSIAGFLVG